VTRRCRRGDVEEMKNRLKNHIKILLEYPKRFLSSTCILYVRFMYVYVALQMHMFPIFDHNFDLKSPENDSDDIARLPIYLSLSRAQCWSSRAFPIGILAIVVWRVVEIHRWSTARTLLLVWFFTFVRPVRQGRLSISSLYATAGPLQSSESCPSAQQIASPSYGSTLGERFLSSVNLNSARSLDHFRRISRISFSHSINLG